MRFNRQWFFLPLDLGAVLLTAVTGDGQPWAHRGRDRDVWGHSLTSTAVYAGNKTHKAWSEDTAYPDSLIRLQFHILESED